MDQGGRPPWLPPQPGGQLYGYGFVPPPFSNMWPHPVPHYPWSDPYLMHQHIAMPSQPYPLYGPWSNIWRQPPNYSQGPAVQDQGESEIDSSANVNLSERSLNQTSPVSAHVEISESAQPCMSPTLSATKSSSKKIKLEVLLDEQNLSSPAYGEEITVDDVMEENGVNFEDRSVVGKTPLDDPPEVPEAHFSENSIGRVSPVSSDDSDITEETAPFKRVGKYSLRDVRSFYTEEHRKYPLACNDKANFRRLCAPFKVEKGKLFHRTHAGRSTHHGRDTDTFPEWVLVVESRREQLKFLKMVHEGTDSSLQSTSLSAHRGIRTTNDILARRVYWPGFSQDVKDYVRSCDTCQRVNTAVLKVHDPLRPVPPPRSIFKQIGVDLIQLPEAHGYRYAIVAIDYLSKFPHAKPLENKTASGVAQFLFEWVALFGYPVVIINDQGREFCNAVSDEFQKLTGVNQRVTRAYNPQANGQVERENRSIKAALLKVLLENITEWPKVLDGVLFALRTQVQRSTGYSPYFMVFGREPTLPLDYEVEKKDHECQDELEVEEEGLAEEVSANEFISSYGNDSDGLDAIRDLVQQHTELKMKVLSKARRNIKDAQEIQKKTYDKRHTGYKIQVGDIVMKKNLRRDDRKGDWEQCPWSGNYEVTEISSNGACTLKNCKTNKILAQKQLKRNLKLYIDRPKDVIVSESVDNSETGSAETTEIKLINNVEQFDDDADGNNNDTNFIKVKESDKEGEKFLFGQPQILNMQELEVILLGSSNTPVINGPFGVITVQDLKTLSASEWTNDQVVNNYMHIICKTSAEKGTTVHVFDTFFFTRMKEDHDKVKTWTKKVDIFRCTYVLIPIHLVNHWTLCVIEPDRKTITYFDSLGGIGDDNMNAIFNYINEEHMVRKGYYLRAEHWTFKNAHNISRQTNSTDCGIYVLFYARMICASKPCRADPQNITRLRKQMCLELIANRLLADDFLKEEFSKETVHNPPQQLYEADVTVKALTFKPIGLVNLGQTCYLNACLQVLFSCEAFARWLGGEVKHTCSGNLCTTGALAATFKSYVTSKSSISPQCIVDNVECFWEDFVKGQQQDVQEFMSRLFVALSKEFLSVHDSIPILDHRSRLTTPVDVMFGGFTRTDVVCQDCNEVSTTFQPFLFYHVQATAKTLEEALLASTAPEIVSNYRCNFCQKEVRIVKTTSVEKPPNVLVVNIKRFTPDGKKVFGMKQCMTINMRTIIHPESPFAAKSTPLMYNLVGVISHKGTSIGSGHYVAVVRYRGNNRFFSCDDQKVCVTTAKKTATETGYILMYQRL